MCELNNPQNTGHFHFILLLGVVDYQCYGASRYQAASLYPSHTYVTQLRSGEDPELRNTLKNASYRGGRAAKCFKYSPTEGDGGVRAIRSSPG